ncbi:hypothetical protein [Nitrosomonas ureae]|nr:hypothetical protein [Nitrosomonas ureae]
MVRKTIGLFCMLGLASNLCFATAPDFGYDGRKGLDASQTQQLTNGEIVFTVTDLSTSQHSGLIEAAVIFNQTPEQTWNLLYRTEDQIKYLKEIKAIKVIAKNPQQDTIEFKVKVAFLAFSYRVNHTFDNSDLNFFWTLDTTFNNDLLELRGFWRFYPYGQDKTLARYGSLVSLKNVPTFIENMFKKSGVANSLVSVKKYVDSGGNDVLARIPATEVKPYSDHSSHSTTAVHLLPLQ